MLLENTLDSVNFSVHFKNVNNFKTKSTKVLKTAANDVLLTDLIGKVAKSKDKQAFSEFFSLVAPRVKGYLMKLGSSDIIAEDLLQEVMLTVWKRAETFDRSKAAVSTWLFTIARNKRIDLLRKEIRPELDPEDPMLSREDEKLADTAYEEKQDSEKILEAINTLPKEQSRLINMTFYEDKSHSIIAQELGIPLGTVKSRIRLASSRLKKILAGEFND